MHFQRQILYVLGGLCLLLASTRPIAAIGPDSGRLRGSVRSGATGEGLGGVGIAFYPQFDSPLGISRIFSAEDGSWESDDLAPGLYRVHAFNSGELIGMIYPDLPCSLDLPLNAPDCDVRGATSLEVKDGEVTAGIDFVLQPGGVIVGRVFWQPGGAPAAGAEVEALRIDDTGERHKAVVDGEGNYRIGGLSPYRRYYLLFLRNGSAWMAYPDLRCSDFECLPAFAGQLQVGLGETRRADQDLPLPVELFGQMTDRATGAPLRGIHVVLEDRRSGAKAVATSDAAGEYRFERHVTGLPPGSYSLYTEAGIGGYLTHIHPGIDVGAGQFPDVRELAAPLELAPGSSRQLDLSVEPASILRGKALGLNGQTGSCSVRAFDAAGKLAGVGGCDDGGNYQVEVAPGAWRLLVHRNGYSDRWVGGDSCYGAFFDAQGCLAAPAVLHAVGPRESRDLGTTQLIAGARISGNLSVPQPNGGLVFIDLFDSAGKLLYSYGNYSSYFYAELPPGRYYLRARGEDDFGPRLYPDLACDPHECDPLDGEPIDLVAGENRGGLDFVLTRISGRCTAEEPCLLDRRFRVKANWRDPLGQTGAGRPIYLGGDSIGITFFDPSNTEVFVKVLDACYPPFDHYWVLAAGLTDVAVSLEVEDTVTGTKATYERPLGQPFAPLFDFTGFPCGAAESREPVAERVAATEIAPTPAPVAADPQPVAELAWPRVQGRCFERYPLVSCLHYLGDLEFRYELAGEWRTREGNTGPMRQAFSAGQNGEAVGLYFFGPENVEMFVKVLYGCHINDHHWLLVAGLTDVGVDLRIRDQVAGGERVFHTEPGQSFAPQIDIEAFPCTSASHP